MTVSRALHFLYEWKMIRTPSTVPPKQFVATSWQPPSQGTIKCNVNAALFSNKNSFSIGVIFHNKHGLLVTTKTIVMRGRVRPLEVEAMALHHTISGVAELGFDNIHFETSCKTVMDYFSKPSFGYLDFNVNLFKCRTKLSHFSNSMVSFVRRQTNFVAYTLTNKFALSFMIQ